MIVAPRTKVKLIYNLVCTQIICFHSSFLCVLSHFPDFTGEQLTNFRNIVKSEFFFFFFFFDEPFRKFLINHFMKIVFLLSICMFIFQRVYTSISDF